MLQEEVVNRQQQNQQAQLSSLQRETAHSDSVLTAANLTQWRSATRTTPQNERMYLFAGLCPQSFNATCRIGILASRNRCKSLQKVLFYKSPWPVSIFMGAIWSIKHQRHLPKGDGRQIVINEIAIETSILGKYCRLLKNRSRPSNSPPTGTHATAKCWLDAQILNVLLLRRDN